jgi:hypothetical protein
MDLDGIEFGSSFDKHIRDGKHLTNLRAPEMQSLAQLVPFL